VKLVTFAPPHQESRARAGIIAGEVVIDIGIALEAARRHHDIPMPHSLEPLQSVPLTMGQLLELGQDMMNDLDLIVQALLKIWHGQLAETTWAFPAQRVLLKAPLTEPRTLRDFYAFEAHVRTIRERKGQRVPQEWYEFPAFYFSNTSCIYGPSEVVPYPSYSSALDFELEIACVIGKKGIDIRVDDAEEYMAGYTIMNDWSSRDIQEKEVRIGLGPAKAKDFATSLGPYLVTPNELATRKISPGRYDLPMSAQVNGIPLSQGNLKDIHWSFCQMIARASQDAYLYPGAVIGSGTVGTGCILELGTERHRWLQPGDRVDLTVDGLGTLSNTVGPPRRGR